MQARRCRLGDEDDEQDVGDAETAGLALADHAHEHEQRENVTVPRTTSSPTGTVTSKIDPQSGTT